MPSRYKLPLTQYLVLNLDEYPPGGRLILNAQVPSRTGIFSPSEVGGTSGQSIGIHVDCFIN